MGMTPAAKSVKAGPKRHSRPVVFPAVRRPVSHPCSRTRNARTAPSRRQGHFGSDLPAACAARHSTNTFRAKTSAELVVYPKLDHVDHPLTAMLRDRDHRECEG